MTRRRRSLVAAASAVAATTLALTGCLFSPPEEVEVTIGDGVLRGVADDGVRSWLGIPYAAPPVDDLRWRAPQAPAAWSGVRDAEEFRSQCLQVKGMEIAEGSSEDCLYLNVFRPDTDEDDLPVMVWLHGGGLVIGSGDLSVDTVTGLVEHDVVVVSVNYRLGRLGYFAHPALAEEGGEAGPVGNFGLLDQVAALRWVRENVAEFGGDVGRVTVFGISAGGASTNYLMSSPPAQGLFHRAISGSGLGREDPPTYPEAAATGEALAAAAGAPDADADTLRGLDAEAVARWPAYQLRSEIPVRDRVLPRSPAETFAAGDESPVPYLTGTTEVEIPGVGYPPLGINPAQVRTQAAAGVEEEVAEAYGDDTEVSRHFVNDIVFTEPARHLAELHADAAPTYLYRFAIATEQARAALGGAVHASDYPFVFGWGDGAKGVPGAQDLADDISACWASFADTGTPSCGDVTWPEVEDGLMELTDEGPQPVSADPWAARLDLVERLRDEAARAGS